MAKQGTKVEMAINIDLADIPCCSQFIPVLARVDVIAGGVTGPVADQEASPPRTTVKSFEVATGIQDRTGLLPGEGGVTSVRRPRPPETRATNVRRYPGARLR